MKLIKKIRARGNRYNMIDEIFFTGPLPKPHAHLRRWNSTNPSSSLFWNRGGSTNLCVSGWHLLVDVCSTLTGPGCSSSQGGLLPSMTSPLRLRTLWCSDCKEPVWDTGWPAVLCCYDATTTCSSRSILLHWLPLAARIRFTTLVPANQAANVWDPNTRRLDLTMRGPRLLLNKITTVCFPGSITAHLPPLFCAGQDHEWCSPYRHKIWTHLNTSGTFWNDSATIE